MGTLVFIWGGGEKVKEGKTLTHFQKRNGPGTGSGLTGAASVLIQSKAVATLQHSRSG